MPISCEVCGEPVRDLVLAPGQTLSQCVSCGHLTRDLARAPAGHRDLAYGGDPVLDRRRLDLTYRGLRRHADPHGVFEIGFGAGYMLRRFLEDGVRVAGADPDQLRLDVDPRVREHGQLHHGPIETLPEDHPQVDLVYGIHVLEHVEDPARTLRVCHRLLRPGGVLQCLTPAGDSSGLRRYRDAWWMLEDPTHVRFYTAQSLAEAARRAGFTDVQVERPLLDSLSTDVASMVRRVRPRPRPGGVLARRAVLTAAMASAPAAIALRTVSPAWRPTLHLVATRPAT